MNLIYILIALVLILVLTFLGYKTLRLIRQNSKLRNAKSNNSIQESFMQSNPESLELLKLEFEYAKATSIQAQQDRLTLVNFYLGLYAGVFTIGFGLREFIGEDFKEFLPYAFFGLAFISSIFVIFIVRLRQAWVESMVVMNRIKDYFLDRDSSLGEYIKWTTRTLPKPEKFKTINFFSALLISMLGSIGIFMGIFVLEISLNIGLGVSIGYLLFSLWSYYWMLRLNI